MESYQLSTEHIHKNFNMRFCTYGKSTKRGNMYCTALCSSCTCGKGKPDEKAVIDPFKAEVEKQRQDRGFQALIKILFGSDKAPEVKKIS